MVQDSIRPLDRVRRIINRQIAARAERPACRCSQSQPAAALGRSAYGVPNTGKPACPFRHDQGRLSKCRRSGWRAGGESCSRCGTGKRSAALSRNWKASCSRGRQAMARAFVPWLHVMTLPVSTNEAHSFIHSSSSSPLRCHAQATMPSAVDCRCGCVEFTYGVRMH